MSQRSGVRIFVGFDGFKWQGADPIRLAAVLAFGLALWYLPVPNGLETKAWHLFAIFVSMIIAVIAKPLPIGAVALSVVAICTLSKTLTIQQALSSFSSTIVWLVFIAFLIARGFIKTGLGARVAYMFISKMGKTTMGLSYGMIATELLLAPLIPSNTARGGGIIFPLITALNEEYDSRSTSDESRLKFGAYFIQLLYHTNTITSAMFLTAMAANPLMLCFACDIGIRISWTDWAWATFVPGLVSLVLLPFLMMRLLPPTIRNTPHAPAMAQQRLKDMGPLSFHEIIMLMTFVLLLTLWILGDRLGIDATVAALIGLSILLLSGVLTWQDVLNEKNAWDTFLWLSILLMLSTQLNEQGLIRWFSGNIARGVEGFSWFPTLFVVSTLYYFSHYFFASMTAHATSMFGAFAVVALSAHAPPMPTVIILAAFSSLCAGLTHYGSGTAPVFYGAGYVTAAEWWRNGAIISVIHLVVWFCIGFAWWKVIGLW